MGGNALSVLMAVQADVSGAIRGLSQVEGRVDSLGGKAGKTGAAMTVVGGGMTAMGAMGAGFLGDAIDQAATYDSTLRALSAATDGNAGAMDALDKKAAELGMKTVYGRQEALDTMLVMQRAGIDTTEIVGGAAQGAMNAATATGDELVRTTEVVSQVMTTFHKDVNATGQNVADTLVNVANGSKSTINDIGYAYSMVGAVASGLDVSMEDTATAIGVLSRAGLEGSDAGTSLKQMLLTLTPTTKPAIAAMKDLGIVGFDADKAMTMLANNGIKIAQNALGEFTINGKGHFNDLDSAIQQSLYNVGGWEGAIEDADESTFTKFTKWQTDAGLMGNAFFDASGSVKSMSEIAGVLNEKLAGATDQERITAFKKMFGTDAVRAAQTFFDAGTQGFADFREGMDGGGIAAKQAETQTQGAAGAMQRWGESVDNLKLTLAQNLLPIITKVADFVSGLVNGFQNLPGPVKQVIAVAGLLVTALALVGGPLLMLSGFLPMISAGFGAITAAIGPVLIPIAAIVAAVVGLKLAWDNNFLGIRDIITNVWTNTIQPLLSQAANFIQVAIPAALAVLGQVWNAAWDAIQAFVLPILQGIFTELSKFWNEISPKLQEIWNFLSQTVFPIAWNIIQTILTVGVGTIVSVFTNAWNGIVTLLQGVWGMIQGVVTTVWAIVEGIIKTGLALLTGDWEGAWNAIKGMLEGVWNGIKQTVEGAINAVKGVIETVIGTIKGIWEGVWNSIGGWATTTWNSITKTVSDGINGIKDFFTKLPGQIWDTVVGVGTSIIDGIIQGLKNAGEAILNILKGLWDGAIQGFKDFLGIKSPSTVMAEQIGAPLAEGVAVGLGNAWGAVDETLQGAAAGTMAALAGAYSEPVTAQANVAVDATLNGSVQPALDGVTEAFKKTFGPGAQGGAIETLMYGKPDGFFNRKDELDRKALDWNRYEVWMSSFNLLIETVTNWLNKLTEVGGNAAFKAGQTISEQLAAGILAGIPAIAEAAAAASAAAGGVGAGTGGGTTNINNTTNVRAQYVDNTSTHSIKGGNTGQGRYSA
jgi:phage-related protein